MGSSSVRNGKGHRAYRRGRKALKRRVATEGLVCHWCGEPIDVTLPHTDRMSFTADHPDALDNGGSLVGQPLAPMHLSCNSRKGNGGTPEIWAAT